MTDGTARRDVADYWLRRAVAALDSAASEIFAGRFDFAANRAYYAAFYSASAVLLLEGSSFVKHSGVRAAVHRDLVKTGTIATSLGRAYDRLFDARQMADYLELVEIEKPQADELLSLATEFVTDMKRLSFRVR